MLDIKPVLHVDDRGALVPVTKVKGRRKSLKMMAEKFTERAVDPEQQVVFISHGDSIDDANYLKNLILEKHKVKDMIVTSIGPVIGSHSGPGTIALFFLGEGR
jgi:DegV family protein with EDD domain